MSVANVHAMNYLHDAVFRMLLMGAHHLGVGL